MLQWEGTLIPIADTPMISTMRSATLCSQSSVSFGKNTEGVIVVIFIKMNGTNMVCAT